MKANTLYAVLNQLFSSSPDFKLADNITHVHDTTTQGSHYYRLELSAPVLVDDALSLKEAHISIFEEIDIHKPTLGPSHFTAIFRDSIDQEFRLHLFLNNVDTLACLPTWEKLNADRHYVTVAPPENFEYLQHEIWQLGLPCLQLLRQQQRRLESELNTAYNKLEYETALLSPDLPANKERYLESLSLLSEPVKILSLITNKPQWLRMIGYIKRLKKLVTSMPEHRAELTEGECTDTKTATGKQQPPRTTSKKGKGKEKSRRHKPSQLALFSETNNNKKVSARNQLRIDKLCGLLRQSQKSSDRMTKAALLIDLNQQLALLQFEFMDSFTHTQVNSLSKLESSLAYEGKKLLQNALVMKNFDLARMLSPFFAQISEDIITVALMTNNAELLAFLASDVGLPVNSYPISIKGKTYPNAVAYCFLNCEENKGLIDCFSALIDGGASLMMAVGPDNLPIAHQILSAKPRHPLYATLEQNKDKTLHNQTFFQHLVKALTPYTLSGNLTPKQSVSIQESIQYYKTLQQSAKYQNSILSSRNSALIDEISALAKSKLSRGLAEALEKDQDILSERICLEKETAQMLQKRRKFRQHTGKNFPFQSHVEKNNQRFKEQLELISLDTDIGFTEMKRTVLKTINDARLMIQKCIELMDVQQDLLRNSQNAGKRNRRKNQLEKRQQALLKEIKELEQQMPHKVLEQYASIQQDLSELENAITGIKNAQKGLALFSDLLKHLDVTEPDVDSTAVDTENTSEGTDNIRCVEMGINMLVERLRDLDTSEVTSTDPAPEPNPDEQIPQQCMQQ